MTAGNQWHFPGLSIRFNFNIFVNDLEERIECTLCKSVDYTKLRRIVNLLEGRKDLQKYLGRLDLWAQSNCTTFSEWTDGSCTFVITTPCSRIGLGKSSWKVPRQKRMGIGYEGEGDG